MAVFALAALDETSNEMVPLRIHCFEQISALNSPLREGIGQRHAGVTPHERGPLLLQHLAGGGHRHSEAAVDNLPGIVVEVAYQTFGAVNSLDRHDPRRPINEFPELCRG